MNLYLSDKLPLVKKSILRFGAIGVVAFAIVEQIIVPNLAQAASTGYLRLDRVKAANATGGTVCANTTTVNTEASVQVTFPAGFTVNSTAANWTVTTTNLPTGATAWPGIATATTVAGQTVTFPSTDLTVSTLYCFNFSGTTTLTNGTAGNDKTGTIVTRTSVPAVIDTINYASSLISDDQIAVSATVPSTFSFALGGNTANLGALSTSAVVSATGVTATVNTNANNGWITWVKSANGSLNSAATGGTLASPGTSNSTPESLLAQSGYILDTDLTTDAALGGTVTIDTEYNGTDTNSGGHLVTAFQPIASSNGPAGGDIITLLVRAKADALTKAATDYTDTLTVSAAGRF
jgi:hypothetical protein